MDNKVKSQVSFDVYNTRRGVDWVDVSSMYPLKGAFEMSLPEEQRKSLP